MAEEASPITFGVQPTLPPGTGALPTFPLAHIAVAVSFAELTLVCGNSRTALTPVPELGLAPIQMVEWAQALVMSPQTAKILHNALADALQTYETAFGAIPSVPAGVGGPIQVTAPSPNAAVETK
jgi:hypothetical protein